MARAAQAAGRQPADIGLIAVSKTFPAHVVVEAVALGQYAFGENYAQEASHKIAVVQSLLLQQRSAAGIPMAATAPALEWHFIGPVQTNKTRLLAEHFDWVHSVDRLKVAQRLAEQRPSHLAPLQVCIQVNVSGETTKSGLEPDALDALVEQVAALPRLRLRGLMAIPEPTPDVGVQRRRFRRLRELRDTQSSRGYGLDTLSMGMSDDLEAAIEEGATLIRVGRAIFGERRTRSERVAG
jgi:PLP dependent protein